MLLGLLLDVVISIHALREEGDHGRRVRRHRYGNFYPRPPRGGRLDVTQKVISRIEFLSTPSARRATDRVDDAFLVDLISIHALREEGDFWKAYPKKTGKQFLSTPSARRATLVELGLGGALLISIHALREEGDRGTRARVAGIVDFYPRPPRGGRPLRALLAEPARKFLSTPSARRATALHDNQRAHQ